MCSRLYSQPLLLLGTLTTHIAEPPPLLCRWFGGTVRAPEKHKLLTQHDRGTLNVHVSEAAMKGQWQPDTWSIWKREIHAPPKVESRGAERASEARHWERGWMREPQSQPQVPGGACTLVMPASQEQSLNLQEGFTKAPPSHLCRPPTGKRDGER